MFCFKRRWKKHSIFMAKIPHTQFHLIALQNRIGKYIKQQHYWISPTNSKQTIVNRPKAIKENTEQILKPTLCACGDKFVRKVPPRPLILHSLLPIL